MADFSCQTNESSDDETSPVDWPAAVASDLQSISSSLSSLIAGIQAIAREQEHDAAFSHIVNLSDLTYECLDAFDEALDRLQLE